MLRASCLVALFSLSGVAAAQDATPAQLRACHDYVWTLAEFTDLPNAAISIVSGREIDADHVRVHWEVAWDDVTASGDCIVDGDGNVTEHTVRRQEQDAVHGDGPSFYYDTQSGKWKTDDGHVCATCTEENGFPTPATDGDFYYDADTRQWRQSSERGAVCHTCTPENGFPIPPQR